MLDKFTTHRPDTDTYLSINALICFSALAYAAPFPITTSGAFAPLNAATTSRILLAGATDFGTSVNGFSCSLSTS